MSQARFDHNAVEVLGSGECRRLLASESLGRVGVTIDALPAILPVRYAVLGDGVVIRTVWGGRLDLVSHDEVVCFEVDRLEDPGRADGWSVLVIGQAAPIVDETALARAKRLDLMPWAASESRDRYLMIDIDVISGRRVAAPGAATRRW